MVRENDGRAVKKTDSGLFKWLDKKVWLRYPTPTKGLWYGFESEEEGTVMKGKEDKLKRFFKKSLAEGKSGCQSLQG